MKLHGSAWNGAGTKLNRVAPAAFWRVTTEGKGMEGGNQFRCTGKWNDEPFDRVIEAEDEGDARDHWMYWAWVAGASLQNLEVTEAA